MESLRFTKQKTQQHDNLTKIVDKFMKTGEFDQAAFNEYFGIELGKVYDDMADAETISII